VGIVDPRNEKALLRAKHFQKPALDGSLLVIPKKGLIANLANSVADCQGEKVQKEL
jgi:hypothetical protein